MVKARIVVNSAAMTPRSRAACTTKPGSSAAANSSPIATMTSARRTSSASATRCPSTHRATAGRPSTMPRTMNSSEVVDMFRRSIRDVDELVDATDLEDAAHRGSGVEHADVASFPDRSGDRLEPCRVEERDVGQVEDQATVGGCRPDGVVERVPRGKVDLAGQDDPRVAVHLG